MADHLKGLRVWSAGSTNHASHMRRHGLARLLNAVRSGTTYPVLQCLVWWERRREEGRGGRRIKPGVEEVKEEETGSTMRRVYTGCEVIIIPLTIKEREYIILGLPSIQ